MLKLCRQQYYRWCAAPVIEAEWDQAHRANARFDAHRDDPQFGYHYLHEESAATGVSMSARAAWKLCSANAWRSVFAKKRVKNKPVPSVRDDLRAITDEHDVTHHRFVAERPNQVW